MQVRQWGVIGLLAISLPLYSNPQGGRPVGDNITIHDDGAGHVIIDQQGNKGIVNWDSFDIHQGETTQFNNKGGVTLNRVLDSKASNIDGNLIASGTIFIINPHGVVFGANANVNVASLVASVADIKDSDFLGNTDGQFRFDITSSDPNAQIVNHGHISTIAEQGLIAIVAPVVVNDGVIEANLGKVALGAGDRWTLDMHGDELIRFDLGEATSAPLYHIDNTGRITANAGSILLTAQAVNEAVRSVINVDGIVEAKSIANVNGKIVLAGADEVNVSGTIDASGLQNNERGGVIQITGNEINIGNAQNQTQITASGADGGGSVLIGGDYQGGGTLAKSNNTTVNNTIISVDATDTGNGGMVVVWSDGVTEFHGDISARGASGGNGGTVETSGKQYLTVTEASINAAGSMGGKNGTWLLDPGSYTISLNDEHGQDTVTPINTALNNSTDVTIMTTADPANSDLGDIFVNDDISWRTNSVLNLSAAHDININAAITNTAGGDLNLRADNAATNAGTVDFGLEGVVDFSQSTGDVNIFYNSEGKHGQTGFDGIAEIDYTGLSNNGQHYVKMGQGEYNAYMLVNTIDDLNYISSHLSGSTNNVSYYKFALGADLNAGGNNFNFESIGTTANPFHGTFNGNGYTINNLTFVNTYNSNDPIGLFGVTDGATLENIHLNNIIINAQEQNNVGAVVGLMQNSTLNNAIVTNSTISGGNNTGGVVGSMINSSANQLFIGDHSTVTGNDSAGGLVGSLANASSLRLSAADAVVTGNVNVGGAVGLNDHQSNIHQSFSVGNVNGVSDVGGFVGNNAGTIDSAYSTGQVTATTNRIGGFAGVSDGHITQAYWNTETSSQNMDAGGVGSGAVGLTTENMTNLGIDNQMLTEFNVGDVNSPWAVKSADPNAERINPSTPYLTWCSSMCTFLVDLGKNNSGGDPGNGGNPGSGDPGNGGNPGSGDPGNGGNPGSGDPGNGGNPGSGGSSNVFAMEPIPDNIRNEIVKDTQQGLYGSTESKLLENPPEDPMDCDHLKNKDQQAYYECELKKSKPVPGSY